MATLKDIIAIKGPQVWSIGKEAHVLAAARLMTQNKVGAVLVTDQERIAGIFTERDLLRRVVSEERDPTRTPVEAVMTAEIICCTPETTVEEARAIMRDRRIRHLPMVDAGGELLGLISIGDLNAHQLASQELTIHMLHEYLYGRV
jgi:CBS domain-containing protein